jgi:hypothetical protein
MTVCSAYRVPGLGAVMVCDGRVSDGNSTILTDTSEKWLVAGSAVASYAGAIGGKWLDLRDNPPKDWTALWAALIDHDATAHGLDYEILAYDRKRDRLLRTDHQGSALTVGLYSAIGAGGDIALGVLDALPAPRTLEGAVKLCQRAVRAAIRRNASCGGRIRTLIMRGRRAAVQVS